MLPEKSKIVVDAQAGQKQNHDCKKNVMREFKVREAVMARYHVDHLKSLGTDVNDSPPDTEEVIIPTWLEEKAIKVLNWLQLNLWEGILNANTGAQNVTTNRLVTDIVRHLFYGAGYILLSGHCILLRLEQGV